MEFRQVLEDQAEVVVVLLAVRGIHHLLVHLKEIMEDQEVILPVRI